MVEAIGHNETFKRQLQNVAHKLSDIKYL
jgi:hypothetical protein